MLRTVTVLKWNTRLKINILSFSAINCIPILCTYFTEYVYYSIDCWFGYMYTVIESLCMPKYSAVESLIKYTLIIAYIYCITVQTKWAASCRNTFHYALWLYNAGSFCYNYVNEANWVLIKKHIYHQYYGKCNQCK